MPGNAVKSGVTYVQTEEGAPPVPEPAIWALLILGFGAIGALMRSRSNRLLLHSNELVKA